MTVCIAATFQWNYSNKPGVTDYRLAAITASDRMVTSADIQHEADKIKAGRITDRAMVLVAGEVTLHSEAIKRTQTSFRARQGATPYDIACAYGREIQKIKLKEAEDLILAPLGFNTDTYHAQQRDLDPNYVEGIKGQLQNYRGDDVEAIVVGSHENMVQIYAIDARGLVTCCDDIGFAAIGIGAWHAKSF